jgi:hypothetical protein
VELTAIAIPILHLFEPTGDSTAKNLFHREGREEREDILKDFKNSRGESSRKPSRF